MTTPGPPHGSTNADWRIGRRGAGCAGCARPFAPGGEAVSAIYQSGAPGSDTPTAGDATAGFERRDWCGTCFQIPETRGTPFSWWSSVVPEPQKKRAVFDLGIAKEFLQRLLREEDASRDSLRYLLALMLMRKRAVVLVGQEPGPDGTDVMTIRVPPDEENVHQIRCAELDQAETERLRDELGRLFQL